MLRKPGLYVLVSALLISLLSIRMDSPPAVIGAEAADSVFSASRAYSYLQEICQAPHSTGTAENKRVREYIAQQCSQFGLETSIQQTTAIRSFGSRLVVANVYNVIARRKGQDPGKSLLIMAHYDTQPNTPGAGDDGAGVAAMLETARILTSTGKKLKNDVVFLFTDAEESGLLGAQGFIQDSVLTKDVGLVLNFEGRGNAGVSSMFEVNAKNGWAIEHYMKAADFPVGNSLGYEIYKILPNDTDYTIFREVGISGLNHAFIQGFVNYHSPNDKAENLDLRSLQQHGSNMLSLIKHFGNVSLIETKAEDISFFTLIGNYMIRYPTTWNLGLTVFCGLLLITFTIIGFKKKEISGKGFIIGFFAFVGLLIVLLLATTLLIKGIEWVYPLYRHFYSSNAYNCTYYFFAFTALAVVGYAILYRWLLTKFSFTSLFAGILLLEFAVLIFLYIYMPTAIFIMVFPLLFTLAGNIVLLFQKEITQTKAAIIQLAFLLPAIVLFSPSLKLLYVVFGLSPTVGGAVIVTGLLLGLLLPLFGNALAETRFLVPALAAICFVGALVLAHFNSTFTEQEPLQSYIQYQYRADENKAYWISGFPLADEWNEQFFPNSRMEEGRLTNDAPLVSIGAPQVIVKKDTTINEIRKLSLHIQSARDAITMRVEFDEKNQPGSIRIDGPAGGSGNERIKKGSYRAVDYLGLDSAGFNVLVEVQARIPFTIKLTDRSMGLPALNGIKDYSPNIIPGQGWNANTTQVVKSFVF